MTPFAKLMFMAMEAHGLKGRPYTFELPAVPSDSDIGCPVRRFSATYNERGLVWTVELLLDGEWSPAELIGLDYMMGNVEELLMIQGQLK